MSSIEFDTDEPRARRKSNEEVVDRVAVRRAMAELIRGITALQREAAVLRAQVERHPSALEQFVPRVVTLGQNVNAASARFESIVTGLSERQRSHSRVEDIRRTLAALEASLPRLR